MNNKIKIKLKQINDIFYLNKDVEELLRLICLNGFENNLNFEIHEITDQINVLCHEQQ